MSKVILVIAPIFIISCLSFIFQSGLQDVNGHLFMVNCPYPIYEGVATNVAISGVHITYDIEHNKDINGNTTSVDRDKVGTRFDCSFNGELLSVSTATRQYGATLFDAIAYGWTGYVSEGLTKFAEKADYGSKLVYLYLNAPAEVTSFSFFSFLNGVLLGCVGLGVFLMMRGGGS